MKINSENVKRFKVNMYHIDFNINRQCNLRCRSCQTLIDKIPVTDGEVPVQQIRRVINEFIELDHKFKRMYILGGEPTLHKDFFSVLSEIKRYKEFNPECNIKLISNQTNLNILRELPSWIPLATEFKSGEKKKHYNMYNAPRDSDKFDPQNIIPCKNPIYCGIAYSKSGFYLCPNAAQGLCRVINPQMGIKHFKDVTYEALKEQASLYCQYCGFYFAKKFTRTGLPKEFLSRPKRRRRDKISSTWKAIIKSHKGDLDENEIRDCNIK